MAESMNTRMAVSIAAGLLIFASTSYAQDGDDPDAWARMLDPAHKAEQQAAASAIDQYTAQRHEVDMINASIMASATPQSQRDELVRTLEGVYARKLGVGAYIVSSAYYIVQGDSYVICGGGSYLKDGKEYTGSFIFNPRPNGDKVVNATYQTAELNGCFSDAGFVLRE